MLTKFFWVKIISVNVIAVAFGIWVFHSLVSPTPHVAQSATGDVLAVNATGACEMVTEELTRCVDLEAQVICYILKYKHLYGGISCLPTRAGVNPDFKGYGHEEH